MTEANLRRFFPTSVSPTIPFDQFVRGDATTDDQYDAIVEALAFATSRGGGVVEFGPLTYRCDTSFAVPNGVGLRGVKGKTKLDTSGRASYENGTLPAGIVQASGSLGAPASLTHDIKRSQSIAFRLTATRSGTTVTAVSDIAHGLANNDLVWIDGAPTASQAVFFTCNYHVGATARIAPVPVTVVDATTFTYPVADTGDTTLSTTAFCYLASDVLQVADTSVWSAGQDVMIRSSAYRSDGGSERNHIGELNVIARVIAGVGLLLHTEVQDNYLVSDSADVVPATFQSGFRFEGIELVGKGASLSNTGDKGVQMYLCRDPVVEDCIFTSVDYMSAYFWSCRGGRARGNFTSFDAVDESGWQSGVIHLQYAIVFGGCTMGLEVKANTVYGGRHAVVQSMTSSALYHGVARNITIDGNDFYGQWLTAISSHQGVDNIIVSNNTLSGVRNGINLRYGRKCRVTGNGIVAFQYGILHSNVVGNVDIEGNSVQAGALPIFITVSVDLTEPYGPLRVCNNQLTGGEVSIEIAETTGRTDGLIYVNDNSCDNFKFNGIRIAWSNAGSTTDGWRGTINDNSFSGCGAAGNQYVIWPTNMKGGEINRNTFMAGAQQVRSGFFFDGNATQPNEIEVMDNTIPDGMCASGRANFNGRTIRNNLPTTLDLTADGAMPSGAALTRSGTAWYFNGLHSLSSASANVARWTYDSTPTIQGLLNEAAETNQVRNGSGIGAAAGTPGTDPTNWVVFGTADGVTKSIVGTGTENGVPYVDIRYNGTPSASSSKGIVTEGTTVIAAAQGQTWTGSGFIKLVGGSLNNTAISHGIIERNNTGATLTSSFDAITPTSANLDAQRVSQTRALTNASTAYATWSVSVRYTSGQPIDVTLRIGGVQLSQTAALGSPIITSIGTVTRPADSLVLTLPDSNIYNVEVTRVSGRSHYSATGAATFTIPTDPSPITKITYRPIL